MIISVGYRVNSKRGTQFRIWANKALLMIAESRADEKDIILKVIVNLKKDVIKDHERKEI